jgi:hypothetical protein
MTGGLVLQPEEYLMKYLVAAPPASFSQRGHQLNIASHAVRERAVMRGYDLHGWRLSHLMRDAKTDQQITIAELGYGNWLQATAGSDWVVAT